MNKMLSLCVIILILIISLSGCVEQNVSSKNFNVSLSDDNIQLNSTEKLKCFNQLRSDYIGGQLETMNKFLDSKDVVRMINYRDNKGEIVSACVVYKNT